MIHVSDSQLRSKNIENKTMTTEPIKDMLLPSRSDFVEFNRLALLYEAQSKEGNIEMNQLYSINAEAAARLSGSDHRD